MNPIISAITSGFEEDVFPGAVLLAKKGRKRIFEAAGWAYLLPKRLRMTKETIFDLSSLTKPVATTTAIMCLIRDGRLNLNDRLNRFLKVPNDKAAITIQHLLSHSSGLPAWRPYYRKYQGDNIVKRIIKERLIYDPGLRSIYSDLGFILLGRIVEEASCRPLDRYCEDAVFSPLGMHDTSFHPSKQRCAATELCPWRKKVIIGEVHDENAWAMGRAAGHAGLFSTASDLLRFSEEIMRCYSGQDGLIPRKIACQFLKRQPIPGSTWALGWDTPTPGRSASGKFFSRQSVGHLGFSGTSLWIDLSRKIIVILLTNRIHPSRKNEGIRRFRPAIHDLVMGWLMDKA